MEETGSQRRALKPVLRALCQSDVAVALLFFILALASRWYFTATHPDYNGLVTVRGVPFSDGQTWTFAAIELIHGHGFGNVYRPFYSLVLALFFVWTNWSFTLIAVVNVLAGAITASFLFLSVRLSFNRCIGVASLAFDQAPKNIVDRNRRQHDERVELFAPGVEKEAGDEEPEIPGPPRQEQIDAKN